MSCRNALAVAAVLSIVGGAASAQTRPPANWQGLVDQYLEGYLKDPYSAVKKVTRGPRFGHLPSRWVSRPPGWIVCYSINARNAYGGYIGAQAYIFVLRDGKVVERMDDNSDPAEIAGECEQPADPITAAEPSDNPKTPL